MNDIEWKNGAVCYAGGCCWYFYDSLDNVMVNSDFQLNEIRVGDYIEKSELDTEQKFNEAVEVFGLFGFYCFISYQDMNNYGFLSVDRNPLCVSAANLMLKDSRALTYNQIMAIGKLKRLMDEKSATEVPAELSVPITKVTANKYEREITDRQGNFATVDVYDVLKAFEVTCPATQHAIKKLLCSGVRGHKDLATDLIEARESIVRAIELNG